MQLLWKQIQANPILKKSILFGFSIVLLGILLGQLFVGHALDREQQGFVYLDSIPLSYELQEYTYNLCGEMDVEYELVLAVMWRESRFQVDAVGVNLNGTQDSGIMQINDVNRQWLQLDHGIVDLMDPYQNIQAGVSMLSEYMHKYGDERTALMAYHLGEGGMRQKQSQGVYTNSYTELALTMRDEYRQLIRNSIEAQRVVTVQTAIVYDGTVENNQSHAQSIHVDTEVVLAAESEQGAAEVRATPEQGESGQAPDSPDNVLVEPSPVTWDQVLAAYEQAREQGDRSFTVELTGWFSELPLDVQLALHQQASQDNVRVRLQISQIQNRIVVAQYTLNPAEATQTIQLTANSQDSAAEKLSAKFEKWFDNKLASIVTGQPGGTGQNVDMAVWMGFDGFDTDQLVFYSYDWDSNFYKPLDTSGYRVDANGYIHYSTSWTGDIVLSQGALAEKAEVEVEAAESAA